MPIPFLIHLSKLSTDFGRESTFFGFFISLIFPGKQTSSQRIEWNHRDTFLACKRKKFTLDLAKQKAVTWLNGCNSCQAKRIDSTDRSRKSVCPEIRYADVTRLS